MQIWTDSFRSASGRRGSNSIFSRIAIPILFLIGASTTALAATTLPTLWTAGGLDAGNTGAGQAARIAADPLGNIAIVSGPAGRDLAVTSYTSNGTFRWRRTISPSSGSFFGDWVAAAPNGDIVAAGHNSSATGNPIAISLVRYASDGTLQWRTDIPRTLPSVGRLVVDSAGDAYLAFNSIGDGQDIQLHKYSAAGALVWSQVINTAPLSNDIATSLAISPDGGEVVLTGSARGGAIWTVASFTALTGTRKWLIVAPEGIAARDLAIDGARIYVTGQGNAGIAGYLSVIAYDRLSGTRLWRTDKRPADATGALGLRINLASDGTLAVTGYASRGFLDWYTLKLDATGAVLWEAVRDGGLNTDEVPANVLALADGSTVVTGVGGPALPGGYIQGVTAAYDRSGTLQWEAFSRQATVWSTALPNGDVCSTGGYDALVTCWRPGEPVTPPAQPTGLTARFASGAVGLAWTDNAANETSYTVERAQVIGATVTPFAAIATLAANAASYRDEAYPVGTTLHYRVRASNSGGDSAYSNTAATSGFGAGSPPSAVISATPNSGSAPLTVAFDGSGSSVTFSTIAAWDWSFGDGTTGKGATTSHVYTAAGTYTARLTVATTAGLFASATTVITVNNPAPVLPAAPSALTATALTRNSIRLNWTNNSTSQTQIRIERCQGARCTAFSQIAVAAGTAVTFTNTGLSSRTTYQYRVRAANTAGTSPYSNTASATTPR